MLQYAELPPAPLQTTPEAEALFEEKATEVCFVCGVRMYIVCVCIVCWAKRMLFRTTARTELKTLWITPNPIPPGTTCVPLQMPAETT